MIPRTPTAVHRGRRTSETQAYGAFADSLGIAPVDRCGWPPARPPRRTRCAQPTESSTPANPVETPAGRSYSVGPSARSSVQGSSEPSGRARDGTTPLIPGCLLPSRRRSASFGEPRQAEPSPRSRTRDKPDRPEGRLLGVRHDEEQVQIVAWPEGLLPNRGEEPALLTCCRL